MSLVETEITLPSFQSVKAINDNMRSILRNAGQRINRTVRNHIRMLAAIRHGTANRLGANPTAHFKASDVLPAKVSEADNSVTTSVITPGIVRAVRDVTILPKEAQSLAIPLHSTAYGFQPRELTDRGEEMFRIKEKDSKEKSNILYKRGDGEDELIPMYLLVRRVFQKKDDTLMPRKSLLEEEGLKGAQAAVKKILENVK